MIDGKRNKGKSMMLLGRMLGEGKVEVSYSLTGDMNKIPNDEEKERKKQCTLYVRYFR